MQTSITRGFSESAKLSDRQKFLDDYLGPDVMQSRFGVNFVFWPGELLGKLPANFSANFDSEFFGVVFPGASGHPKNSRPKFTSRIVGISLQFHFLEPKLYSWRFAAYGGDQDFFGPTR